MTLQNKTIRDFLLDNFTDVVMHKKIIPASDIELAQFVKSYLIGSNWLFDSLYAENIKDEKHDKW